MALSPSATVAAGDFETAPDGVYSCVLVEVREEQRPSFEDPAVTVPQLIWRFESTDARGASGDPYSFVRFTGTRYGNENANLTRLINGIFGRELTPAEFDSLTPAHLASLRYRIAVSREAGRSGRVVNRIVSVRAAAPARLAPPRSAPVPAAEPAFPPADADYEDPFAE